jgi:hypothetical protein
VQGIDLPEDAGRDGDVVRTAADLSFRRLKGNGRLVHPAAEF